MLTTALLLLASLAADPLPLPGDFDPAVQMRGEETDDGILHPSRETADFLAALIRNGAEEDVARARRVLTALEGTQELDPERRHYGNFRWMAEDDDVTDFNAVSFILKSLIPAMLDHGDTLPEDLRADLHALIQRGLVETLRRDVPISYTNITVFDVHNLILGGRLVNATAYAEAGTAKFQEWAAWTMENGTAAEYNSPTYTKIAVNGLGQLARYTTDDATRITAETMAARLALGVALRIHPATGRWAGPHSRAYHPSVIAETGPEIDMVKGWLRSGLAPPWVRHALSPAKVPCTITATADRENQIALTTHLTGPFALGSVSRGLHPQADALYLQYSRPGSEKPGILYTRYLLDDKWFGDFYHSSDRTHTRNLNDEGLLISEQSASRAIALYGARPLAKANSAKATLIWTGRKEIDTLWVDGEIIDELPATVADEGLVILASGDVFMAVRPLSRTDLGGSPPIRLVERGGDLVLEIYNYQGERPVFRALLGGGRDRVGRPQCGFYLEVAERTEYADISAFARTIQAGSFTDNVDSVLPGGRPAERLWTAGYTREGVNLGLSVDLMRWRLDARWNEEGPLGWPQLTSPLAIQNSDGHLSLAGATLSCGRHPAWLFALPEANTYAAGYVGPPAPLTLTTPDGVATYEAFGTGMVSIINGEVDARFVRE